MKCTIESLIEFVFILRRGLTAFNQYSIVYRSHDFVFIAGDIPIENAFIVCIAAVNCVY